MKPDLRLWRGVSSFFLLTAIFCHAQVRINEVLTVNRTAFSNGGAFPSYVELYNTNTVDVNIGRWGLALEPFVQAQMRFVFPLNTIVPARGYLIVFCDKQTNAPGLHTGFELNPAGDGIVLLSPVLALRDRVSFGYQIPDHSIGRHPDGGTNAFQLATPTPGGANNTAVTFAGLESLRINEWMARAESELEEPESDWFELYNAGSAVVNISGCVWTDQNHSPATNGTMRPLSFIARGAFIRFFANDNEEIDDDDENPPAGQLRPGHVDFKLSSTLGDQIILLESNRVTEVIRVEFPPQGANVSQGCLPDGNTNNIVYFADDRATPGESNYLPIENVRINEVLTNPNPPGEDAIELYNPSGYTVQIGGWYLSDSKEELKKFRIPNGTSLAPFGFTVFYEFKGFPNGFNPNGLGVSPSFSLNSARAGQLILSRVDWRGELDGYRREVDFGPAAKGVSFGRYFTSIGETDFVPMKTVTLGNLNSGPRVGPVVITEIMYHPPDFIENTNLYDNTLDEYIELYNRSTSEVRLFDANARTNTWRIEGDVDFQFPTNVVLSPGEFVLIVSFSPSNTIAHNVFRAKHRVPPTTRIFGPWQGRLANGDGNVELLAPEPPQPPGQPEAGFVPYVAVEKVKYFDNRHRSFWPLEPDGEGYSLARLIPEDYVNDIANWRAEEPSPGKQRIELEPLYAFGNTVAIRFTGWTGSAYSVLRSSDLVNWAKATDVPVQPTSGPRHVTDVILPGAAMFYRVVTPMDR